MSDGEKNSGGVNKAAILLMSLGEEDASKVMMYMESKEVQAVGSAMAAISNVDVLIEKYPSPKELTTICSELSKAFNEPSPKTKCFKTHGEEIVKDLGYKFDRNYQHDQFNTNRYRKDILLVEFTYKGTELLTIDLIIGETDSRSITYEELKAITPVICKDSK